MAFVLDEEMQNVTNIKVIGVGGGGGNAVNRMVEAGLNGVEFVAMNTDQQALVNSKATQKVQLGAKLTKGRGAGADPEVGQRAAEESKDEIANALKGAQMVFITAGMGGGTGTGAAPVVAETAHDLGILTVGIVTKPFAFEGKRKMSMAEQGIANLMMHVDSLIVIPNERLKLISQEKITLMNAFEAADNVLRQGVESISSLINVPAFINLDFADVRSIMKDAGFAHMGVGVAKGAGKAENAAKAAISSPLLETSIAGARVHPVLFCFSGKINGCLGTIGTGTCHNGDSARYLFRAIFNHIQMFFMRQCGRLSCGTAYNNGIGTVCNLEFNHFRKLFVIYLTVFLHGCYNGNTCTLKNRHTFPPYPLKNGNKKAGHITWAGCFSCFTDSAPSNHR